MKNGWQRKKICEIAEHSLGKMLDKAKNKGELQPYLRNLNVRWFGFDLSDILEMRFLPAETAKYTVHKGDVLICEGGYPGRAAIWQEDEPIFFQKALHRVRFHEQEHSRWFIYYLYAKDLDGTLKEHFNGAGIQHFTGEALAEFEVPIPPLAEQQRIVGILDEAFEGIATAKANAEKNLQNARALFASHLESVFTQRGAEWVEKTMREVCTFSSGGTPSKSNSRYWRGKIPWVSGRDMKSTRLSDTALHISQAAVDESATRMASAGMLLILVRGMGLAHGAQIAELLVPCAFNQDIRGIHPKPELLPQYLLFALRDRINSSDTILSNAAHGTLKIDSDELQKVMIPFPPLEQQRRIVSAIDALAAETQRLAIIYERKLAALEALKKSLLHQAFTGQLTADRTLVSVPNVIPFPVALPNITTTDLHAGVLALAYQIHEGNGRQDHFTHVKAEKIAHMVEARLGIDLGRQPVKDAAGPNDFNHLQRVEHRARKANYFDFKRVDGGAYRVQKLRGFDRLIERAKTALGDRLPDVEQLLEWMLKMNPRQAEIIATIFAAWNNLLLDGKEPDDEEIVRAAREDWHPDKLNIKRERFFKAVEWLREQGVVPEGRGKRVVERTRP